MIPFNKPTFIGTEPDYMKDAVQRGHISGNGYYGNLCQQFFEKRYGFIKTLLTPSCTAALEMSALLCDIQNGDEVIMPSYTFPSMANAFVLRGAKIVFIDCKENIPNINPDLIEAAITPATKAIVVVHYAGFACEMDTICALANKHGLFLIEDCAHAIDSCYKGKILGSFGHFAAFSFHETKNITCGEGGMLVINKPDFVQKAEIIWEKGTSRVAFGRGEIDKYNWVGIGSSYVLSDLNAAYLYAQLLVLDTIQANRVVTWQLFFELLQKLVLARKIELPVLTDNITKSGNLFYFLVRDKYQKASLLAYLLKSGIMAVSHYEPLHSAPFSHVSGRFDDLTITRDISERLIRLPLYYNISEVTVREICKLISTYFQ